MSGYRSPLFLSFALVLILLAGCQSITRPSRPPAKPTPRPTPAPTPRVTTSTLSVRDFLKQQLGANFHPRAEWAGTGQDYAPRVFSYRVWEPIGKVYAVTIHHAEFQPYTDSPAAIRTIFRDHTRIGGRLDAADVGYHFIVDARGQVWECRDAARVGTHVGSRPAGRNNPGNLGICGLGDFRRQDPPKAMSDQIVNLTLLLAKYYGRPLLVRGHRDWGGINGTPESPTSCPGRLETAVVQASIKVTAAFAPAPPSNRAVAALTK